MGLLDSIKDLLGQGDTASGPTLIAAALEKTDLGSLQGIVSRLQAGGFDDHIKSWLGDGKNLPITADQIQSALGNQHVQQIAQQCGLPVDAALALLAEHLPTAIDQASPTGTLTSV